MIFSITAPSMLLFGFAASTVVASLIILFLSAVVAVQTRNIRKRKRMVSEGDERYLNLLANSSEQLWCVEFDEPLSLALPEQEQIERIFDARVVEANKSFANAYGATLAEVLRWQVADFIPREYPASVPFLQDAVRSGFRMNNVETKERAVDGTSKYFVNNFVGTIRDGCVLRIWGMCRDVTESRELEKQVRLHQAAMESTEDGFTITDVTKPDFPLIYVNEGFQKLTGYPKEESLGRNCRFLQGADTDPLKTKQIRKSLQSGEKFQGELLNYRKNGEPFWNFLRLSPVFNSNDQLTHFVGIQTDVSERKQNEAIIKQQRREITHVSRVATLGELGAALAHEINQPMASILRNAEAARKMLESEALDREELLSILEDIVRDDRRAGKVLERIRYHIQKVERPHQLLSLNENIIESLSFLEQELFTNHLDVTLDLAPDLPSAMGDEVELQQMLINLVLNAEQAMENQEEDRKLTIRSYQDEKQLIRVIISDNGPGIHTRDLERIFSPFYSTKTGGLGMGLAINRSIVNAHGGRIWVESDGSRGARFVISIPPADSEDET